jgi:hypothetical protein
MYKAIFLKNLIFLILISETDIVINKERWNEYDIILIFNMVIFCILMSYLISGTHVFGIFNNWKL